MADIASTRPGAIQAKSEQSALSLKRDQITNMIGKANFIHQRIGSIADDLFGAHPTQLPEGAAAPAPPEPDNITFLLNKLGERLANIQVELDRF